MPTRKGGAGEVQQPSKKGAPDRHAAAERDPIEELLRSHRDATIKGHQGAHDRLDKLIEASENGRTERTDKPPGLLLAKLGKMEAALFCYLWSKPVSTLSELHVKVWAGRTVLDEAIQKAARRIDATINENRYDNMSVCCKGNQIILTRKSPDK